MGFGELGRTGEESGGKIKGTCSCALVKHIMKTLGWCVLFLYKIVNPCLRTKVNS
jgi:hypothetical protein